MHSIAEKADFDTAYFRSGSIIFNDHIEAYQAQNEGAFQQLRNTRMSVLMNSGLLKSHQSKEEEDVPKSEISG